MSQILEYEGTLIDVNQKLAELDVLLSLSEVARDHDYCRPHISEDNGIFAKVRCTHM